MSIEIRQRQHRPREKRAEIIDPDWLLRAGTAGKAEVSEKSERQDLLERRAALLSWFDPHDILESGAVATVEDADLAAVLASSEIVPTQEGPRRRLQNDARRAALKRMGTRAAMNKILEEIPFSTADPIQRMLVRVVKNENILVEKLDRDELASLLVVIDWMQGIVDDLPAAAPVRARLAREDLVAPLRHLAKNFVGREAELDRLRGYLGDVAQGSAIRRGRKAIFDLAGNIAAATFGSSSEPDLPLFIHGIGGVGKSTLVARFGLELADLDIPFVFLDLDRPHLDPRKPATLLAEAARQLRVQLPSRSAAAAQKLADDLDAVSRNMGPAEEAQSVHVAAPRDAIERFCDFVRDNATRNLPFIVDTFEIAQSLGDSTIYLMRETLSQLQRDIPQLRPILSGRAMPEPDQFPTDPVPLTEFDLPSGERFLAAMLADKPALASDPAAISLAVRSVERTPLALTLTAQLLAEHGINAVRSPRIFGIALYTKDAAFLYNRILDHIPPGRLRKLAKPGLVLRRLSPAIIRHVLSNICDLKIANDEQAQELFGEFARQVSLVQREPGGLLRHRPDVRRLMLPALEREVGRTVVRAIDAEAVKFHSQFDEATSRAEELYHRLRLSDIEGFEVRWRDDVSERLREAIEDFESRRGWVGAPEARVALSLKLGLTPDSAALEVANLAQWERATTTRVSILLQQGEFETALKVLKEREPRTAASPLFRQEAEALMGVAAFPEASAVAERGVESAREVGDTETIFENAHLAARACEAMGDTESATNWLNVATEAATRLGQAERLFRIAAVRSRLHGGVAAALQYTVPSLVAVTQGLLRWGALDNVTTAPTLRALAAASGDESIKRAVLRRLGVERLSPVLSDDLAELIARIAGGDSISAQSVRAIFAGANESIPAPDAPSSSWKTWLASTSNNQLGNALAELSRNDSEYGVADEVTPWIDRYFKDVAAAPESQETPATKTGAR